ncbi:hypothetical protein SAMN02745866_01570 [Alteromonadaceae bacterium Bs31]|nr:hypothetical protein SAMN02745866_01570 [Alteromonadaceae bacterium Bs31]
MNKSLTVLLILLSVPASAATLTCKGKVTVIAYHSPDRFMVQLESMNTPVFFCNPEARFSVSGTHYETGPESCKMLYSSLLAAQAQGKYIDYIHFDGDDVPAKCSDWETWRSSNIRYLRVHGE